MLIKNIVLLIVGKQSKFSEALRQVKRQHYEMKFWNWGPTTIWHNMESEAFFLNHFTLLYINSSEPPTINRKCPHQNNYFVETQLSLDFWGHSNRGAITDKQLLESLVVVGVRVQQLATTVYHRQKACQTPRHFISCGGCTTVSNYCISQTEGLSDTQTFH